MGSSCCGAASILLFLVMTNSIIAKFKGAAIVADQVEEYKNCNSEEEGGEECQCPISSPLQGQKTRYISYNGTINRQPICDRQIYGDCIGVTPGSGPVNPRPCNYYNRCKRGSVR